VLVFQLQPQPQPPAQAAESAAAAAPRGAASPAGPRSGSAPPAAGPPSGRGRAAVPARPAGAPLAFAGRRIPLEQIRSAHVRSRARYPHSFSWWALISLGGLVLLPWPFLFWPLEIGALVAWILLGSRKDHVLIVTLRDGMAHRHSFANKITALSHRNGIRGAIGQSPERAPLP
jgi:hypothetical protein